MDSDQQTFFRAMEAAGEDNTPRLVYADWLEERGDSVRANFIRLQVEAWQKHGYWHGKEYGKQFSKILRKHRLHWMDGMPAWTIAAEWRRGFPHITHITGKQFLDDAGTIRERMPLSHVSFSNVGKYSEQVFTSEHFAALRSVGLGACRLRPKHILAFATSKRIANLVHLSLPGGGSGSGTVNQLSLEAVQSLANSRHLKNLRSLDLSGYPRLPLHAVRAILESKQLAGLTNLILIRTRVGLVDLAFGSAHVKVQNLEQLVLSHSRLVDAGADRLAKSPYLSKLVHLDVSSCRLTDDGVLAFIQSPYMKNLRRLDVTGSPLTDRTADAVLADGRNWEYVRSDSIHMSSEKLAAIRFKLGPPSAQEWR